MGQNLVLIHVRKAVAQIESSRCDAWAGSIMRSVVSAFTIWLVITVPIGILIGLWGVNFLRHARQISWAHICLGTRDCLSRRRS